MDNNDKYVEHDHFPPLSIVDHSKKTIGCIIDKLMDKIQNICDEMKDEYDGIEERQ